MALPNLWIKITNEFKPKANAKFDHFSFSANFFTER